MINAMSVFNGKVLADKEVIVCQHFCENGEIMSTRAVYSFKDEKNIFHVYKHCDGHPSSAIKFIKNSINYAWKFPRFEAADFSAAFVAANKEERKSEFGGGDVYLTHSYLSHKDLEYRYEIECKNNELFISVYDCFCDKEDKNIFCGTLFELLKKIDEWELE